MSTSPSSSTTLPVSEASRVSARDYIRSFHLCRGKQDLLAWTRQYCGRDKFSPTPSYQLRDQPRLDGKPALLDWLEEKIPDGDEGVYLSRAVKLDARDRTGGVEIVGQTHNSGDSFFESGRGPILAAFESLNSASYALEPVGGTLPPTWMRLPEMLEAVGESLSKRHGWQDKAFTNGGLAMDDLFVARMSEAVLAPSITPTTWNCGSLCASTSAVEILAHLEDWTSAIGHNQLQRSYVRSMVDTIQSYVGESRDPADSRPAVVAALTIGPTESEGSKQLILLCRQGEDGELIERLHVMDLTNLDTLREYEDKTPGHPYYEQAKDLLTAATAVLQRQEDARQKNWSDNETFR